MADASDSKSDGGNLVPVQVRPPAGRKKCIARSSGWMIERCSFFVFGKSRFGIRSCGVRPGFFCILAFLFCRGGLYLQVSEQFYCCVIKSVICVTGLGIFGDCVFLEISKYVQRLCTSFLVVVVWESGDFLMIPLISLTFLNVNSVF